MQKNLLVCMLHNVSSKINESSIINFATSRAFFKRRLAEMSFATKFSS